MALENEKTENVQLSRSVYMDRETYENFKIIDDQFGILSGNIISLTSYNIGTADDSSAINQTFTDAVNKGYKIIDGKGKTYNIKNSINIPVGIKLKDLTLQLGTAGMKGITTPSPGDINGCLDNVTIIGTGTTNIVEIGVFVTGNKLDMTGLKVSNLTYGVQLTAGVQNCSIEKSFFTNIVGASGVSEGYGIICNSGTDNIIRDNFFATIARHAIYLSAGASRNIVKENNIYSVGNIGIQIYSTDAQPYCDSNVIDNNVLNNFTDASGSSTAIYLNLKVKNNKIMNNIIVGASNYGIVVNGDTGANRTTGNEIINNHILLSGIGVEIIASDYTTVSDNTIDGASTSGGIGVYVLSSGNSATGNEITGNRIHTINTAVSVADSGCSGTVVKGNSTNTCTLGLRNLGTNTQTDPNVNLPVSISFTQIAAGAVQDQTVNFPGAAVSDLVIVSPEGLEAGITYMGFVSASNTITVRVTNLTGAAYTPFTRTWHIVLIKSSKLQIT